MSMMRPTINTVLLAFLLALLGTVCAQDKPADYRLGPGDAIRIVVFQNPELSLEARVSESGTITYPLIGTVAIGGLSLGAAEQTIGTGLKTGGFVKEPQVNIMLVQIRGSQVSVLGQVGRPGRFPLETANTKVTEMLATAGGIAPGGADTLILTGVRNGKPLRLEIDVPMILMQGNSPHDVVVQGGDIIYVHRAPQFYIHGEVQRPGPYRLERDMTLRHALAHSGGISLRGTERGIRIHRREADGTIAIIEPAQEDIIKIDDVIYVNEALF